ncbi:MAG TPA: DUF4365 domain-containing protein [Puia sp.]|nr:DUF4365 domain-containing protein [Puia sp.]
MLNENLRKSELSIAYAHAIAIKCGYALDHIRIDDESVDVSIRCSGKPLANSILSSPSVGIQLKSTSNWEFKNGKVHFDLKMKNYNDLKALNATPKILVVLCLPQSEDEWISFSPDDLTIRKLAYWLDLYEMPDSTNAETQRVYLEEHFSPDKLKNIIEKISMQEWYNRT